MGAGFDATPIAEPCDTVAAGLVEMKTAVSRQHRLYTRQTRWYPAPHGLTPPIDAETGHETRLRSNDFVTINRRRIWMLSLPAIAVGMTACGPEKKAEAPVPRPVRTVTAAPQDAGETVVLTGHIQAEDEAAMAFRIGGRMIERFVNVGDQVKPGQELARLDPQNEVNALRSTQASLGAAQAQLTQARAAFERQRTLLAQGHTPRAQFDLAEKALRTAQAQVDDGEVQVRIAADRVSYTVPRPTPAERLRLAAQSRARWCRRAR